MTLFAKLAAHAVVEDDEEKDSKASAPWGEILAAALGAGALGLGGAWAYKNWDKIRSGEALGLRTTPEGVRTDAALAGGLGALAAPAVTRLPILGGSRASGTRTGGTLAGAAHIAAQPEHQDQMKLLNQSNQSMLSEQHKAEVLDKLHHHFTGPNAPRVNDITKVAPKRATGRMNGQLRPGQLDKVLTQIRSMSPADREQFLTRAGVNPKTPVEMFRSSVTAPDVSTYLQQATQGSNELGGHLKAVQSPWNAISKVWNPAFSIGKFRLGPKPEIDRIAERLNTLPNAPLDPHGGLALKPSQVAGHLRQLSHQPPSFAHRMGGGALRGAAGLASGYTLGSLWDAAWGNK